MEATIPMNIDREIEKYKTAHAGNAPLYIIMATEEADELTQSMRQKRGEPEETIITSYRDIKIIRNNLMERGEYFLSNELPETGS